jgi:hypothetical protein
MCAEAMRAAAADSSLTVCIWRSLRITVFGTYQGASSIIIKAIDWKRSRMD